MTVKTVYDAAGMIVRVVDLLGDDPVRDAEIENIPPGGTSVEGNYGIDTEYFVAGVPTDRPVVDVDTEYEIVADGEDSFWFDVPDETIINTPDGQFEATADSLVSISSRLVGQFTILVVPPEPYQQSVIEVTVLPDDGGSPNLPPTTPDIEILLSQTMLTNLAVLAKPKFNVVSWDVSSDPEHDHYGLTRYESEADADADSDGVDLEPIVDAFYKDADEFVNGVDCWYRVWDVDTNGNRSEKSDPVGEVARGVQTPDIEPKAISPSKLLRPLTSNLIKDYDLLEKVNLTFTQQEIGPGTESPLPDADAIQMSNPTADGLGGSNQKFRITLPLGYGVFVETERLSPVEEDLTYEASFYLEPVGAWSTISAVYQYVKWWTTDASGDIVALSDDFIHTNSPSANFFQGAFTAPAGATYASLEARIYPNPVGGPHVIDYASPKIRQLPVFGDISDVNIFYDVSAITFGNTTGTSVASITGDFTRNIQPIKSIEASARFKQASGAVGTFNILLQCSPKGSGSWDSIGEPYTNAVIADDRFWEGQFYAKYPTSGGANYVFDYHIDELDFRLLVDPAQAGNDIRQRNVRIRVFYS